MVLSVGCAANAGQIPRRGAGGTCDAAKAQALVGRRASAALGAEALRLSGATALRWIRPGTMVTMDYREGRLNLHLGPDNAVTKIACG